MNIEILISGLLNYYHITTITQLAQKLDTTQSTISGWRARNAIGALTDRVATVDSQALAYIFSVGTQNNTISNTSVNSGGSVIDNSNQKNITVGLNEAASNNIPAYLIDDLNNLFLRASKNNRIKEVIEAFDDFIYTQKKNLRD